MKHRLQEILNYYQLTAAEFANTVGVNPSGLSHILSGKRNNLSIDTILKILDKYPDIELNWLILGKGNMTDLDKNSNSLFSDEQILIDNIEKEIKPEINFSDTREKIQFENPDIHRDNDLKQIVKVLLIYSDNSFKELKSEI